MHLKVFNDSIHNSFLVYVTPLIIPYCYSILKNYLYNFVNVFQPARVPHEIMLAAIHNGRHIQMPPQHTLFVVFKQYMYVV